MSPSLSVLIVYTPKLRSSLSRASLRACTLSMSNVPPADTVFWLELKSRLGPSYGSPPRDSTFRPAVLILLLSGSLFFSSCSISLVMLSSTESRLGLLLLSTSRSKASYCLLALLENYRLCWASDTAVGYWGIFRLFSSPYKKGSFPYCPMFDIVSLVPCPILRGIFLLLASRVPATLSSKRPPSQSPLFPTRDSSKNSSASTSFTLFFLGIFAGRGGTGGEGLQNRLSSDIIGVVALQGLDQSQLCLLVPLL